MSQAVDGLLPGRWTYQRVHAAACGLALRRWLRRWAVYALVTALIVGAGAGLDSALSAVLALAAWAALPLARGASSSWAWGVAATLATAALGLGLLAAMRNLIWPVAWREAERALPLTAIERARSDFGWIALASTPWAVLQGAGLAVWLVQQPAWLLGREAGVVAAGLLSLMLTWAAGMYLQHCRRRGGARRRVARKHAERSGLESIVRAHRISPFWALIGWPMLRGRAGRFATHQALSLSAAVVLMGAVLWRPAWAPWWLALQAMLSLVALSRAITLARLELWPLLDASAALPLSRARWAAGIDTVCALQPLGSAWILALLVWASAPGARAGLLAAWGAWIAFALFLELRVPTQDAQVQGARWLFMLIVALAVGSEVLA